MMYANIKDVDQPVHPHGTLSKSAEPHNAISDQCLHCLISLKASATKFRPATQFVRLLDNEGSNWFNYWLTLFIPMEYPIHINTISM